MSEELLINVTPQETRVATVENGMLSEIWIERARKIGLVGTIFQGTVNRVLPGMDAAFINIGLEKAAFLHVSDIRQSAAGERSDGVAPNITNLLNQGQKLAVQVIKDPLGTKGARVSSNLTAPSRYLVMMPYDNNVGVSVRIESEEERERLRSVVESLRGSQDSVGYIVRTAAEGVDEQALQEDMQYLEKVWAGVKTRLASSEPGVVLFRDLPLVQRMMRDLNRGNIERIRIDSRETYRQCVDFCNEYVPELCSALEHYPGERPIFDLHGVDDEIDKALDRKVMLKSGGYLIIDQTESMTTIDVNTGGFVGSRNLEETIFKTNLEAAQAIARQLRLRNLGGIIIIDFIDMSVLEHRRQVLRALEKALERDHARTQVNELSLLGLVEMTRKRTRESLEQVLCGECPVCDGRGMQKTLETVGFEVAREIIRQVRQFDILSVTVLACDEIVEWFTEERSDDLAELQDFVGVPIRLQAEQFYSREHFDVVLQ